MATPGTVIQAVNEHRHENETESGVIVRILNSEGSISRAAMFLGVSERRLFDYVSKHAEKKFFWVEKAQS